MTIQLSKGNNGLPLEIPDELVQAADLYSNLTQTDSSTVLLRWLRNGSERELLQLVSDGELSMGKFIEVMGITYYDIHDLAQKYGIELGPTAEESRYARENFGGVVSKNLKAAAPGRQE